MNCGDFRYLIQRRFDVELSPADDRALLVHLETCDSCQKFYHQVQQVIIAAEELELSEELLPPNPDQLLNNIIENIPKEKSGIKELIVSFLSKLGLPRFDRGNLGTNDLSASSSEPAMLKRLPGASSSPSRESFPQSMQPVGGPISNWGRSTEAAGNFTNSGEIKMPTSTPSPRLGEEQVVTRSLSEKFGVSGVNNTLANTQPLTLADSIRQKISEMSKTGGEYASGPQSVELPGAEQVDEWSIPHSPEWPKLQIDASPEQWPLEQTGAKAPNVWGNPAAGWGNMPVETTTPSNDYTDNQFTNQPIVQAPTPAVPILPSRPDPFPVKPSSWSTEAEQMETGTWQTVEFDTTLGASRSYEPQIASSLPANDSSMVQENLSIPVKQDEIKKEELKQDQIKLEEMKQEEISTKTSPADDNLASLLAPSTENLETILPASSNGPKIYPVVSRRAQSSASMSSLSAISPKPENAVPVEQNLLMPQQRAEEPLSAAVSLSQAILPLAQEVAVPPLPSKEEPVIDVMPMDFTIANEPQTRLPFTPPSQNTKLIKEEIAKPTEVKESPSLFQFDDGAIDKLFSNNLGVHERSISAQAVRSSSSPNIELPTEEQSNSVEFSSPPAPQQPTAKSAQPMAPPFIPQPTPLLTPQPIAESPQQFTQQPNSQLTPQFTQQPAPQSTPQFAPAPPLTPQAVQADEPLMQKASIESNTLPSNPSAASGLFVIDDNMIDRIFTDHLGVPEKVSKNVVEPQPIPSVLSEFDLERSVGAFSPSKPLPEKQELIVNNEVASPPIAPAANSAPQFGSSPHQSSGKQKVVGVGKLDSRIEPLPDTGSGRIASIGKFLLDNKDLEKIGRITSSDLSDGKLRTLTLEANDELKALLTQVDAQQGVLGTLIVGHDGLLIAHTMSQDSDAETLGVEALAVYMGTVQVVEKLGDDNVRQIVSLTNQGYLIVANFGAGLLVTLTNPMNLDHLLPLMRTITQLVAP